MNWTCKNAVIRHAKGIHARVAAMVVQKAHELEKLYKTELLLISAAGKQAPATNIMAVIALKIRQGEEVRVAACGQHADKAASILAQLLESDFMLVDAAIMQQVDDVLQDNAFTASEIFNSMANGLIAINEKNIITIFNPAAERITGIAAEAALGRHICEIIPNSRLPAVNQSMVAELGQRQEIGNSVVITNRTPIIVNGQSRGAVAIFEDISIIEKLSFELKQVKELQQQLQLVLETVQDGICVTDHQGTITYVNPAYTHIIGQKAAELVGINVNQLSPQGARSRVLSSGQPVVGSISVKPNGAMVVANVNPIIVDNEVVGTVSVVKNMSEIQEIMHKLSMATEKAEYLEHELRRVKNAGSLFKRFIGKSGLVRDVLALAAKAASSNATVLIRGESGTGKELIAEGIHYASQRAGGPFIRVNCAAIPVTLLESELFGYEKGAFTGAVRRKLGKFELAHKGTIFLDEIGDMDKAMQVKLLRVLQHKEFERVGGERTIKADVRIIAATNCDLEKKVAAGEFREDLYYRLNVIPIFLPPLRERREDIPLLVEHFLHKFAAQLDKPLKTVAPNAMEALMRYRWPGNVRELENIIERLCSLSDNVLIGLADLPPYISQQQTAIISATGNAEDVPPLLTWAEYEKAIITKALTKYGSYNAAGKALGLTHRTVAAKARKYGLTHLHIDKKYHD
ncbi:sigma 54-interacting transcriptional regulator [Sporolituus thermophilus]|uniref:HTH-type transcriptional regulatory protein TyrR n=1 Tax=Sporolituus thermophilus DSM 23256 TaxID=1123285 RepID=A0A1G7L969_9FIRM|nr:sigma 54-interacting transcriptional regulator [Sporolituus thermophilus]SDF46077.1 phosphotransferase system HPr (HPr) family [Sporolituus thermophilus DSM 23256]